MKRHRTTLPPGLGCTATFCVVQSGHSLLLCHVPDDEQVVCRGRGEQVGVVRAPADGRDGLLVFGHDGSQLELVVLLVQLNQAVQGK